MDRSQSRRHAIEAASKKKPRVFQRHTLTDGSPSMVSDYFATNVFKLDDLETVLTKEQMSSLKGPAPEKNVLDKSAADKIAETIRTWAVSKGATHYCHWFQPQTGTTAEKHDSFFSFDKHMQPIESFTGKLLLQQEPDASSFPSGGRRSTFEARGYTAWDPNSPIFLRPSENGTTLCIPSIFVSYSGEALDHKTPLLRSVSAVSEHAREALGLLEGKECRYVLSTCGPEQEYFVIDRSLFSLRPDLMMTGRTLIGKPPAKTQQLEDHYFGSIRPRVLSFMQEVETELYMMGVPCKTRHNEVAPSQCELAIIYESANVAADHNYLVLETLETLASRHDLVVLRHEKPYTGMNGSGKHLNWSLQDDKQTNLLDPGQNPAENLRFLYFVTAVVKAIHQWGGLLRSSVATAGNDFRLGANEAPPAIMSVFLGETLTAVFERLGEKTARSYEPREIHLDLARIPSVSQDNTDRNRTSPFAFTGNKFEFRALGSSQSVSYPTTFLNTAVAWALSEMNKDLRAKGTQPTTVLEIIRSHFAAAKAVCFEGNGYSTEWHKEAEARGLPNLKSTPEALTALVDKKAKELFINFKVFTSEEEIDARFNVLVDRYVKTKLIELETMQGIIEQHVLPAAESQMQSLGMVFKSMKKALDWSEESSQENAKGLSSGLKVVLQRQAALSTEYAQLHEHTATLKSFLAKAAGEHDEFKLAVKLADEGARILENCRKNADELEGLIDSCYWSLPTYQEMVYTL